MAFSRILSEEIGPVEGVLDTGIVAIAHFDNPAKKGVVDFLSKILRWERKCMIPTSSFLGAYHIMTEYIGVERVAAHKALIKTLELRSPAFYEDISIDLAVDAITYADGYHVESWDGYIIALSRLFNAPVIYSIDKELMKKVREVKVVNPISEEDFKKYNEWLRRRTHKRTVQFGNRT